MSAMIATDLLGRCVEVLRRSHDSNCKPVHWPECRGVVRLATVTDSGISVVLEVTDGVGNPDYYPVACLRQFPLGGGGVEYDIRVLEEAAPRGLARHLPVLRDIAAQSYDNEWHDLLTKVADDIANATGEKG